MIRSLISGFGSSTPTSWTIRSVPFTAVHIVAYNGSKFICQSADTTYMSTDGITWVKGTTTYFPYWGYSITYSSSTFILVGYNVETFGPAIVTSPDGITWTARTATVFGTTAEIVDICWSGAYLVAVSNEGHIATASSTGVNWTQRAKASYNFECVAFGAGIYIAYGNVAWTSTNGTTWTARTATSPSLYAYSITYGNGLFVAVGSSGKIYTTTDGITWTKRTSPFGTTTIRKVTYGASKFVAVGDSGKIATSTDGINWTLSESPVTTSLIDVVYGASKFVAVGDSGKLITSPTGL